MNESTRQDEVNRKDDETAEKTVKDAHSKSDGMAGTGNAMGSPAHKGHSRRLNDAWRLKRQALESFIELKATTLKDVVAKAKVLSAGADRARSGRPALA